MLVFLSRSVLSATLLGHWRQQHLKGTAFRSRFLLDLAHVLGVGNDTFEDALPAILWRFLASCFFFCVSYLNLP